LEFLLLSGKVVVFIRNERLLEKALEPRLRELKLELRESYHHPKALSITKSPV